MKKGLFLTVLMVISVYLNAATRYSYNNGGSVGWSSTDPALGAPTPASTPGESDNIIITNQISVTIGAWRVGQGGNATIIVRGGGVLNTGALEIKNNSAVVIQGGGVMNSSSIIVSGGSPGGTLNINSGGTVNVSGDFTNNNNSDGVRVDGTLIVGGNLTNGNNSDIVGTGGISVGGSIANNGTIGGATGPSLGTLPVTYTYFSVSSSNSALVLTWQTATEENNDYFVVERSENGQTFYSLGQLNGNGTSTDVHNYTFKDTSPIAKTEYYRLKQVDFDGTFEYSEVKVGYLNQLASSLQLVPYPNPAVERISFNTTEQITFAKLQLLNLAGQEVANLINNVEGFGLHLEVKLPIVEKGLYYIHYTTTTGEKGTQKLIIK